MSSLATIEEWPFCQTDEVVAAVVTPSYFPLAITKDELFEWGYRVKKWNVDFSLDYTCPSVTGLPDTETGNVACNFDITSPATTEKDMVCDVTWSTGSIPVSGVTGSWSNTNGDSGTDLQVNYAFDFLYPAGASGYAGLPDTYYFLRLADDSYIPCLSLLLYITSGDLFFNGLITLDTNNSLDAITPLDGTIAGKTLPFSNAGGQSNLISWSGNITITPAEYWPFDPGDGLGAIWNSTTGAQLRDPLSIP